MSSIVNLATGATRETRVMKQAGCVEIIHMDGGFDAWRKVELPAVNLEF